MRIRHSGDTMLLVELEPVIDPVVNERVIHLARRLRARQAAGIRDIVPGYGSLGIRYDPLQTDLRALELAVAEEAKRLDRVDRVEDRPVVEIPVVYGGDAGPDLEAVARHAGLTPAEVIARHSARTYRVY